MKFQGNNNGEYVFWAVGSKLKMVQGLQDLGFISHYLILYTTFELIVQNYLQDQPYSSFR